MRKRVINELRLLINEESSIWNEVEGPEWQKNKMLLSEGLTDRKGLVLTVRKQVPCAESF